MKYYQMAEKVTENSCGLYGETQIETKTGHSLIDYNNSDEGEAFVGPYVCVLDDEMPNGYMPTFFMSPAIIGTKQFYKDLSDIGIDNIEVYPVEIRDEENDKIIDDYLLLNILGRISCAAMAESDYARLNDEADEDDPYESMNIIDKLVIDASKVGEQDLFLVHEDTDCIVISERVYRHLQSKGYTDIYFEELQQV